LGLVFYIYIFGADPTGPIGLDNWPQNKILILAGTATLGVAAQALILFVAWNKAKIKFHLNFKWRGFGLRPALRAAAWSLGMVIVTQIGGVVQTFVASSAISARAENPAIASVAAAGVAWLIFMVPHSVVTVSISTAYFTKMTKHAHAQRLDLMRADFGAGLRAISLFAIFFSIAISVLAYPMSRVFIGEFDATVSLGNVLIAQMLGLLPFSFVYMIQRAFYALENTRTPFYFTLVQIGLHMTGSAVIFFSVPKAWLVVALAALTSFTLMIQAILAYSQLAKRIGSLAEQKIATALLQFVVSGLLAGGVGYAGLEMLGGIRADSFVLANVASSTITIFGLGFVMFAIYSICLRLLKVSEIDTAISGLKGILRR
jgi:putative peptidoglycan lipid II flippase